MFSFSSPFDPELVARLNEVPVPADLLVRLRRIPVASDADMDAALAEVTVPSGLSGRLMATTQRDWRWPALFRQAVAAVVVFAVSLAYAVSVVAFVSARFDEHAWAGESVRALAATLNRAEPLLQQSLDEIEPPVIELASLESGAAASAESPVAALPSASLLVSVSDSLPRWTMGDYDGLPIERPAIRLTDGKTFDERFWRQTGTLPWIDVAPWIDVPAEPLLELPLVSGNAGYRLFRLQLASGRLLPPPAIRVEDFLAGINYGLAAQRVDEPTIMLAAAPSPFSCPLAGRAAVGSRWLLTIGVVMPEVADAEAMPTRAKSGDVQLAVRFDIDQVEAFRVLGYGPPHSGGSIPPAEEDDEAAAKLSMSAGGTAMVVCEFQLAAGHKDNTDLARVSITAPEKTSPGRPPQINQTALLRVEAFSDDYDTAPIVWQQAALVALAAEFLAGSPFAEDVSVAEIAARARQIEPRVYDRAGWREFIEMLAAAQSARGSLLRAF